MRHCVARSGVVPQPPTIASQINHLENVWAIFNRACMRSQPRSNSVLTILGSTTQSLNGAATVKKIAINLVLIRLGSVAATVTTHLLVKNKLVIHGQAHLSRRQTSRCASGFPFPFLESAVFEKRHQKLATVEYAWIKRFRFRYKNGLRLQIRHSQLLSARFPPSTCYVFTIYHLFSPFFILSWPNDILPLFPQPTRSRMQPLLQFRTLARLVVLPLKNQSRVLRVRLTDKPHLRYVS